MRSCAASPPPSPSLRGTSEEESCTGLSLLSLALEPWTREEFLYGNASQQANAACWSSFEQGILHIPRASTAHFESLALSSRDILSMLTRSISLAVLGLASGAAIGGLVQGWLRVDIVPLGALSSPSAVVSEFGLLGIFAAAAFLY